MQHANEALRNARSVFSVLLSERPPQGYVLYDVTLVGIQEVASGKIQVVECGGETAEVPCPSGTTSELIGRRGYLTPHWESIDAPASTFTAYMDQTLRRAVELDAPDHHALREGRRPDVVGWRCDAKPQGFRAPAGLVPGRDGAFVSDDTAAVVLRVPRELRVLANDHRVGVDEFLRAFMADVCDIRNTYANPRADGLSSNGSDERDLAEQWFQRAFGHRYLDNDTQTDLAQDDAEAEYADPIGELLSDFQDVGGSDVEVITALRAMIAARQAGKE